MPPAPTSDLVEKYQRQLLDQARFVYQKASISGATQRAFLATPRHSFVKRYREGGSPIWHDVTSDNLLEHIAALYADHPLTLFGEEDQDRTLSTISQPSFVLHMLDMLQLQPGQKVFELGTGSGWNAALMSHVVGPEGHVYSIDILPEIASAAQKAIAGFGLQNVTVLSGEGGEGYAPGAPYDRAFFTAGSYDIPGVFYDQVRDQGLLLIGLKSPGGGDNLFLFRKVVDHFESIEAIPCAWVQLRGKYQIQELAAVPVESLAEWSELQNKMVATSPFWWGGTAATDTFGWRTLAIRSFLSITEPLFRTFKIEKSENHDREEQYFGLWDSAHRSLVLAKDDALISYGNRAALDQLMQRVRQWMDLGMPIAACFKVAAYRSDQPVRAGKNQWLVKRRESQFLWSL